MLLTHSLARTSVFWPLRRRIRSRDTMSASSRHLSRYLDTISMEADGRSEPNHSRASGLSGGQRKVAIRPQPPPSGLLRQDLPRINLSPPTDKPHPVPVAGARGLLRSILEERSSKSVARSSSAMQDLTHSMDKENIAPIFDSKVPSDSVDENSRHFQEDYISLIKAGVLSHWVKNLADYRGVDSSFLYPDSKAHYSTETAALKNSLSTSMVAAVSSTTAVDGMAVVGAPAIHSQTTVVTSGVTVHQGRRVCRFRSLPRSRSPSRGRKEGTAHKQVTVVAVRLGGHRSRSCSSSLEQKDSETAVDKMAIRKLTTVVAGGGRSPRRPPPQPKRPRHGVHSSGRPGTSAKRRLSLCKCKCL